MRRSGEAGRRRHKVHVITLGCAKNQVDSEKLMAQLRLSNVELAAGLEDADVVLVNTCGFIEAAKAESIDALIETVRRKADGKLKKVYAMGCLTERYREELSKEVPEVDAVFGTRQLRDVLARLGAQYHPARMFERAIPPFSHSAYLKISEGCDHPCSFCAIPLMRGKHVSVPLDDVLTEAGLLAGRGVKELVVIGQDTTSYGLDICGRRRLHDLLGRLSDLAGIEWVRLMYAYPSHFPDEVLDAIAGNPKICKYLDLPVQHVSDTVLRSMRRGISAREQRELLEKIRNRVPGLALRTTLIVGYPTETESEFEELLQFVEEQQFHRLGVFPYSQEDGTASFPLGDPVPPAVKEERKERIMEIQREISLARNESLIGTVQKVLIDRKEDGRFVGRTAADAPEIDNEVYVRSDRELAAGTFCDVEIVEASEYDTYGNLIQV